MSQTSFKDGVFSYPIETEGSPMVSTDAVTTAKIVKRRYFVLKQFYSPLPQASLDIYFPNCYLINEEVGEVKGSYQYFTRTYIQVPPSRSEPRQVSFTYPGQSLVNISSVSGQPIGFDPHGISAPSTRPIVATVTYSYAVRTSISINPAVLFAVPSISFPKYQGAPVDYTGLVAINKGTRTLSNGTSEPNFQIAGAVTPPSVPPWIISVEISRWEGPIFQMEVVSYSGPFTF